MEGLPKLVLVEDDARVARAIARGLRDYACVVPAANAGEARRILRVERPFVLVVDEHLPDGSGFDLILEARSYGVATAAVLISGDSSLINLAFEKDVRFLHKPFDSRLLSRFVVAATRSQSERGTSVVTALEKFARKWRLTPAESEILEATLAGQGRKAVARLLNKSEETVKTQIHKLLDKTELGSMREVVAALLNDAINTSTAADSAERSSSSGACGLVSSSANSDRL